MLPRPLSLLIIRHAEAEPATATTREADEIRALTDRGRRQSAVLGPALRNLGHQPDIILTSPLVRARQTAAVLRDESGTPAIPIEIVDALRPGKCTLDRLMRPIAQALDAIRQGSGGRAAERAKDSSDTGNRQPVIALVGHQPDLGSLILELIAPEHPDTTRPQTSAEGRDFVLRKGSVVVLTYRQDDPDTAPPLVEAVLQPRHARLLGTMRGN
jgi:phosphohistidine phosphatase SixA